MDKQPEVSIYSAVPLNYILYDVRAGKYGMRFGTVENICKQYGIRYVEHPNCRQFIAPKLRLQLFLEKLHFSRTPYTKRLF